MKSNYDQSLQLLLKDEGGYTNNPNDNGGPTNYGITLADYRRYINSKGTALDVKTMRVEDAKTIYKTKYWDAIGGDVLPIGVDYALFDYGVNSGLGRVKKYLTSKLDPVVLINKICDERLAFLQSLKGPKGWATFGKGWGPRVSRCRHNALQMAAGALKTSKGTSVASGAVIASGVTAVATTPHHYWPFIVGGVLFTLCLVGLYEYLRNKQ